MLTQHEQEKRRRRLTYRFVQLVLIALSLGIVVAFISSRRDGDADADADTDADVAVTTNVPDASQLAAGDAQLFSVDSTVDVILKGDRILSGLSPKTVERIKAEMADKGPKEGDGVGGAIATAVKASVASTIGIHASFDIRDISDIRWEDGKLIIEWKSGDDRTLFGAIKKDGRRGDMNEFHRAEAERFIELVKARQQQISTRK